MKFFYSALMVVGLISGGVRAMNQEQVNGETTVMNGLARLSYQLMVLSPLEGLLDSDKKFLDEEDGTPSYKQKLEDSLEDFNQTLHNVSTETREKPRHSGLFHW